MAINVTSEIIGDKKVITRFQNLPSNMANRITRAMDKIAIYLVAYVKENKLSGQVLRRRTGTLSRSIRGTVEQQAGQVVGNITSRDKGNAPLPYAVFWENGFTGTQNVRAHVRKMASGGEASVRAFVRNVHQIARPFFAPTLKENQNYIRDQLNKAVSEELQS